MILYRCLTENDMTPQLFDNFIRRQFVTDCRRFENGHWIIKSDPFIDDWTAQDYAQLIKDLKNLYAHGGFIIGAFIDGILKGFASVDGRLKGSCCQYADLTNLHVSEDFRRRGIGSQLFNIASDFAKSIGAKKLYISSHSAIETQNFYKHMGCIDTKEPIASHVEAEPYDCQLEFILE